MKRVLCMNEFPAVNGIAMYCKHVLIKVKKNLQCKE